MVVKTTIRQTSITHSNNPSNTTARTDPQNILHQTQKMTQRNTDWPNPFGDGKAAQKILVVVAD